MGARDVEGVAIDTAQRMLYLITKREAVPVLHSTPYPTTQGASLVWNRLGEVQTLAGKWPTAMDFAADGSGVAIVTHTTPYLYYFARKPNQTWLSAINNTPQTFAIPPQKQAEAVTFAKPNVVFLGSEQLPTQLVKVEISTPIPTRSTQTD